jgi:DNA-binding PadR family transcriptional regulator
LGKRKPGPDESESLWQSIIRNYEFIEGAQLSNSLICLLALSESSEPISTTQISEYVARKTKGNILKVSGTIKDSLERRLKKAGYVEGLDIPSKKNDKKPIRVSLYKITPKGRKLLKGWTGFLHAVSN